jgi:predicted metalloenzyme YecM
VLTQVREAGFHLDEFVQIDHMCYRTVSLQNYQSVKRQLAGVGQLLRETRVNGRPIAVFRLHQPVRFDGWRIDAVELPAPKPGRDWDEGLEHIEFVLFDDIKTFLARHKDKEFDLKSMERGINPEVGYSLGRYGVKFHLLSLPAAVYLEQKLGIDEV